jgi:predicted transcriptional regulator
MRNKFIKERMLKLDSLSRVIDVAIRDSVPQIFKRPYLSVLPNTTLMQIAPFMAIGPQIYVDGLVVLEGEKPVGKISSKQILLAIINSKYPDWLKKTALQIMDTSEISLEMDNPMSRAIDIFNQTSFAFIPITKSGLVVASLSVRDVLPVIMATNIHATLKDIASPLVILSKTTNLKLALNLMFQKKIRNIIVESSNGYGIINDRKILEFLFSQNGRKIMDMNSLGIQAVEIDLLDKLSAMRVSDTTTVNKAAELLMDINIPCVLLNKSIVTPWDIVMKTIESISI